MSAEPHRIGYVAKVYPRFSETFVVNELLAHERAGCDLEVFSLRPPEGGRFHASVAEVRAPITYVPSHGIKAADLWGLLRGQDIAPVRDHDDARDVFQAAWLAREARRRGIDHLHAHFANVAAEVARLAARLAGVGWSMTAHAKDIFHEEVDPERLGRLLRDARATVTVSEFNARHLRELCPEAAPRVHRVYNGLDLAAFAWSSPVARPPRVVAVGRLVEKKGFGVLVEACARLAAAGRPVHCDIVGGGPHQEALAARVEEFGLGAGVRLLGPRTQDEVRERVGGAAVLAAPCIVGADGNRDGMPTVLLEAMALGTPCVSTPVTGIPELVRDGETGLLVAENDPAALAAALERLLEDPPLRERLARAGRELLERSFQADRSAARVRELWAAPQPALEPA